MRKIVKIVIVPNIFFGHIYAIDVSRTMRILCILLRFAQSITYCNALLPKPLYRYSSKIKNFFLLILSPFYFCFIIKYGLPLRLALFIILYNLSILSNKINAAFSPNLFLIVNSAIHPARLHPCNDVFLKLLLFSFCT